MVQSMAAGKVEKMVEQTVEQWVVLLVDLLASKLVELTDDWLAATKVELLAGQKAV